MDNFAGNETDLHWLTEASKQNLPMAAFDVAMRWAEFHQYGSEQAACKALRQRSPGLPAPDYVEILRKAVRLLEAAHLCLKLHATELTGKQGLTVPQHVLLAGELETACPGFERSWYALAVWWVWYTDYHPHG